MKYIVIHCSDTPDERNVKASEIHKWHLQNGWDGIGYHKAICRDGEIQNGRPDFWTGSHVAGKNTGSVGICMIGRNEFSDAQYSSLALLLRDYTNLYPDAKVVGHCELDPRKTCPNPQIMEWLNNWRS